MTATVGTPGGSFLGTVLESELHPGVSFRIERALGQGGTATAFFATRVSSEGESPVVVKVILPRLVLESGEQAETIIKKEAVALGRLNERVPPTPFVVRLLDTGAIAIEYFGKRLSLPWIALEYVHGGAEGTTLEARVRHAVSATGFGFDPARAAHLLDSLAQGLTEIHAVGVVHRDLTPGNVLCCGSMESEIFKISDFGIAKPVGLQATFGDAVVGTPGYVAPEQIGGGAPVSPASDVFSLATIVYFALTGSRYFEVNSPTAALIAASTPERKSVLTAATLCQEFRDKPTTCEAIDLALARATAPDPKDRPQSAALFAQSLLPWIREEASSNQNHRRWFDSLQMLRTDDVLESRFTVRHPPGQDRLLLSVAWNASGHCLATSTRGLLYWDGVRWAALTAQGLPSDLRVVRRLSASTWLAAGSHSTLVELSGNEVKAEFVGPDPSLVVTEVNGDPSLFAAAVVEGPNAPPALCGIVARRWLLPLPVEDAACLSSLARIDDERFLVVGRARKGGCYAAIFEPLRFSLARLAVPEGRALLAAAGSPDFGLAVAVGTDGAFLRVEREGVRPYNVEGRPDFSSAGIDVRGQVYAAGAGTMWGTHRTRGFCELWKEVTWRAPFISLQAEMGLVTMVTVDGGVLECRSASLDATKAAM